MINRLGTLKEKVTKKQHLRIDEQCKKTNGYSKRVPKGNARDQKHCNKTEHCLNTFISRPGMGGFPGGSEVKASACNAGDLGSIPGLGRPPGEGNGRPLQYSCLENPMDGGAW